MTIPGSHKITQSPQSRFSIWIPLGFLLLLMLVFFFSGCDSSEKAKTEQETSSKAGHSAGAAAPVHHSSSAGSSETEEDPSASAEGTNLDYIPLKRLPYEELTIPAMGMTELYARLYDPSQPVEPLEDEEEEVATEEEAPVAEEEELGLPIYKYPVVILMHSLNGSYRDWDQLPAKLVDAGYAVLVYDARGHGKSAIRGKSWRTFGKDDWQLMANDPASILDFFTQNPEDYPQVDPQRAILMGGSIGANAAILAASKDNERVRAVVALSAGLDYKGLETTKPIYLYKNSLLMIASQNDTRSFEATRILYRLPTGPKALQLYRNIGHGNDMVRFFPELQDKIIDWLKTQVAPTPIEIIYPEEEEYLEGDEEGAGEEEEE